MWELREEMNVEQDREELVEENQIHLLILSLLFLLLINLTFHLFIVKEQVTNDFAIVKSTKQYANLTNNPTPFAIIQFKGIDYGQFCY